MQYIAQFPLRAMARFVTAPAALAAALCVITSCGGSGSEMSSVSGGTTTAGGTTAGGTTTTTSTSTTGGGTTTGATTGTTTGAPSIALPARSVFPADNPWNQDISGAPVDPNSATIISAMDPSAGLHPDFGTTYNGAPNGIAFCVVSGTQARVAVSFQYADESDPGPYPIPANAPIEGGASSTGDRHVLVIDRDNWKLYELYDAVPQSNGSWTAGSGAVFDLASDALRPSGWTSADAAGLPIFPGLVRYDEMVGAGAINHTLRFTVQHTRHAYVSPARHYASSLTATNLPPMGMRVRLKAFVSLAGFSAPMQALLTAMKTYGMFVADNGSDWYVSGAPDPRWSDDDLHNLGRIHGSDFEVVQMGTVTTN